MATTAAAYATDDVSDEGGVDLIENGIEDEDIEDQVITVSVSTGGELQWQASQQHDSPTSVSQQVHGPRRYRRDSRRHRHLGGGPRGCGRRGPHARGGRCAGYSRFDRGGPRRRLHHRQQLRTCACGRRMEGENVTVEQRLVGECDRLAARLGGDAANLTRQQLIARYIARKMHRFGVADVELRQTVSTMLRHRFDNMTTCCEEVETAEKIECVRRAMSDRFGRVCNGDEPICPWMLLRTSRNESRQPDDDNASNDTQQQQSNMTATCCPRQDSERLSCFLDEMAAHRQRWRERMALRVPMQSRDIRTVFARARGMRRQRMRDHGGYGN